MQLTQKIRIFPTSEQTSVLWLLSELCRLIYNFALAERIEAWRRNNLYSYLQVFPWGKQEWIGYIKQQNELPKIKKKYPRYKSVNSKVLQMVLRTLDADFKSFFALRRNGDDSAMPPKFKGKSYFTTMTYNQSGFKVSKGSITLAHDYNNVPLTFAIPERFRFGRVYQVSLFYDGEAFYLSVVHEVPEKPYADNELYQAIDLGIDKTVTAVNTQGKFFEAKNPRPDKYWNPTIDAIQSRRDHCKKGSNKWKHLHKAMNKRKSKCSNQIRDYQHKLTRKMVDNTRANTFLVGDLDVKKMPKSRKASSGLNRSTQNNGYLSQFVGFLAYKAVLAGKKVIEIDERNTSKRCYVCGKEHDMPLWKRTMECDCGNLVDRDRNSTVAIMLRFLSQNAMWTGYQQFVDNLRKTGLPAPTGTGSKLAGSPMRKRGEVHERFYE
jgi:putative transposase